MKKLMTLLLALTLLLTACGTAPENTDPSGTTAPHPPPAETPTPWVPNPSPTPDGETTQTMSSMRTTGSAKCGSTPVLP